MIQKYVEAASTYAGDIDSLILTILAIVGFWFVLAELAFFWLIFRFREREGQKGQYVAGEAYNETKWVSWPHYATLVFDVFIIYSAIHVWYQVKQTMPPADETVRVIAQQWAWTFVHPGPDGKLDTPDDIRVVDELHAERGKTYHFELTSRDVLHSFSVPAFRLKQDIIPGRVIKGWFKPTLAGQFDIQCTEICGIGHGLMPARIFIETPEQHSDWLKANSVAAAKAPSAPAPGGMP